VRLILAAALALAAAPAAAQMYKCVDARGVTHYTDKPQPGCKGGPVDIRGSPLISGAPGKPPAADAKVESPTKAANDPQCVRLRQEYEAAAGMGRMHMDQATLEARLASIKEQMRGCP
jgi:hypothetical protein